MRGWEDFDRAPLWLSRRHDPDLSLGGRPVFVPQPESLADTHAGVVQDCEEQPVTKPLAGVEDGLRFGRGKYPRLFAGGLQADLGTATRLALADVVKERPPRRPSTTRRLPPRQQFPELHAVAGRVLVEGADR